MEEFLQEFSTFVDSYVRERKEEDDPYRQGYVEGYADALEYVRDWLSEAF